MIAWRIQSEFGKPRSRVDDDLHRWSRGREVEDVRRDFSPPMGRRTITLRRETSRREPSRLDKIFSLHSTDNRSRSRTPPRSKDEGRWSRGRDVPEGRGTGRNSSTLNRRGNDSGPMLRPRADFRSSNAKPAIVLRPAASPSDEQQRAVAQLLSKAGPPGRALLNSRANMSLRASRKAVNEDWPSDVEKDFELRERKLKTARKSLLEKNEPAASVIGKRRGSKASRARSWSRGRQVPDTPRTSGGRKNLLRSADDDVDRLGGMSLFQKKRKSSKDNDAGQQWISKADKAGKWSRGRSAPGKSGNKVSSKKRTAVQKSMTPKRTTRVKGRLAAGGGMRSSEGYESESEDNKLAAWGRDRTIRVSKKETSSRSSGKWSRGREVEGPDPERRVRSPDEMLRSKKMSASTKLKRGSPERSGSTKLNLVAAERKWAKKEEKEAGPDKKKRCRNPNTKDLKGLMSSLVEDNMKREAANKASKDNEP